MKSENEIMTNELDFFDELFDFSKEDPVDIKKTAIASDFCSLLFHAELSRTELSEKLGWKKSRLSKVLNGKENLTIRTMVELTQAMGYDFDINFHHAEVHRCLQPWEENLLEDDEYIVNPINFQFIEGSIQSAMEVFNDISRGKQKDYYLSFAMPIDVHVQEIEYPKTTLKMKELFDETDQDFSFITNTFIAPTKKVKSHG